MAPEAIGEHLREMLPGHILVNFSRVEDLPGSGIPIVRYYEPGQFSGDVTETALYTGDHDYVRYESIDPQLWDQFFRNGPRYQVDDLGVWHPRIDSPPNRRQSIERVPSTRSEKRT